MGNDHIDVKGHYGAGVFTKSQSKEFLNRASLPCVGAWSKPWLHRKPSHRGGRSPCRFWNLKQVRWWEELLLSVVVVLQHCCRQWNGGTTHYLRTLHKFKSSMPATDHMDLNNVSGPLELAGVHRHCSNRHDRSEACWIWTYVKFSSSEQLQFFFSRSCEDV